MRWLVIILVLDLAVASWIALGASEENEADFIFACPGAHRFLDPQRMSWLRDIRIAECLFEPLTRVRLPDMVIGPGVAKRWQVSEDGKTYTFSLRPDARWSNGDPVRSGDFIYAWRRALLPDLAADYSQMLWAIKGAEAFFKWRQGQLVTYLEHASNRTLANAKALLDEAIVRFDQTVGLSAPDDRTLVVELVRPVPYFLQLCAFATFMPVHQATVEAQISLSVQTGRLVQDPYWTRPGRLVCNGPYVLKRRRFKRDLLMVANPHYWNRSAMGNASILERIVPSPSNALLLYEAGRVDWLPDIPSSGSLAADLVEQGRRDVQVFPASGTYFYNFNCRPKALDGSYNVLSDSRVRRALSMAIDRQAVVENITRLGQPTAMTFVPVGALPGYRPPVEAGARFDPQAARKLLAEAGYNNPQSARQLQGLSILYNTGGGHEHIAQAVKRMWDEHLGVKVKLEGQEVSVFGDRLRNHDFTIARAGWFGDYLDPTTFLDKFRTGNGNNDAAYSNPQFDRLIRQAEAEMIPAKRMVILQEAEKLMLSEQPIAPINQYVNLHVFDPQRVQGLHLNPWNFRRLEFVRVRRP